MKAAINIIRLVLLFLVLPYALWTHNLVVAGVILGLMLASHVAETIKHGFDLDIFLVFLAFLVAVSGIWNHNFFLIISGIVLSFFISVLAGRKSAW